MARGRPIPSRRAPACDAAPIDGIEIDGHLTANGHVVAHQDHRMAAMTTLGVEALTVSGPAWGR